jgi:hypothetical protein
LSVTSLRPKAMGCGWGAGDPGRSGEKRERLHMRRSDDREVTAVERRNVGFPEPLGGGDDRRVDGSERKVGARLDELCHPLKVRRSRQLQPELSTRGRPQQRRLSARAERFPD